MSAVHAWTWPIRIDMDIGPLWPLLCAEEQDRAVRFHGEADRRAYVVAHAGMRHLLARQLACEPSKLGFTRAAGGKPRLHDCDHLHFNLSHSAEYAVLATGPFALGVDIEVCRSSGSLDDLLYLVASPVERAAIEALTECRRAAAFFRMWVRKEALLKAIGCGLPGGADQHHVGCEPWHESDWRMLDPCVDAESPWLVRDLPAPQNHVAAIVTVATGFPSPALHHQFLPDCWLETSAVT